MSSQKSTFDNKTPVWSPRLRHSDISIEGLHIIRKEATTFEYSLRWLAGCLSDRVMDDTHTAEYCWSVKVDKFQAGVVIGMCQIRQAQSNRFQQWAWRTGGHGHYCVFSNGLVVSHSEDNTNWKREYLHFAAGDVLHFRYDPKEADQYCEMNIEKNKGQKYAVCAYLKDINDSLSFISQ